MCFINTLLGTKQTEREFPKLVQSSCLVALNVVAPRAHPTILLTVITKRPTSVRAPLYGLLEGAARRLAITALASVFCPAITTLTPPPFAPAIVLR